jgi:hypothetical protein
MSVKAMKLRDLHRITDLVRAESPKAIKQYKYSRLKRKAAKIETWSTEETMLPDAYAEAVAQYTKINPARIIGFRFKVWLNPVTEDGKEPRK